MPARPERLFPPELLQQLRDDPMRAPEIVALASAHMHAPQATKWIAEQRGRYTYSDAEFAQAAKRKHATLARLEGAATGVGGIVTMLPDLIALAWIQSRLIVYIAAAFGFDPADPMRPAEMLVLRGLYDDPVAARQALDFEAEHLALHYVDRSISSTGSRDEAVVRRLATFVGRRGAKRIAGRAIPGFAIAFNATTNELDTRRLADKAIVFYGGADAGEPDKRRYRRT